MVIYTHVRCCFNVWPPSATLAQHQNNIAAIAAQDLPYVVVCIYIYMCVCRYTGYVFLFQSLFFILFYISLYFIHMFAYGYLLTQYSPGLQTFNYLFSHKPIFLDIIMLKFFCNIHLFFFVIFTSRPTHYISEFPTYPRYVFLFFILKGLAQAKIIKKSVILFRVLNMTI